MRANKITNNGEVLLDLTQDTATPETVGEGVTFHTADGSPAVGTAKLGGGAELNIAYGDEPPEDTTKLWVKTTEPSGVIVSPNAEYAGNTEAAIENLSTTMPSKIYDQGCASVGTKIYLFGGTARTDQILCYDTETETLTTLGVVLPIAASSIACATVGTNIYLFGGSGASRLNTILCFDTETQSITTLDTVLPTAAYGFGCAVIGTDIYLFGGSGLTTIMRFDTKTQSLTTLAAVLPKVVYCSGCATVGTKIYLLGGYSSEGEILCFDTKNQTITTLDAKLPSAIAKAGCGVCKNKIYLLGGGSPKTDTIYCLDTKTEALTVLDIVLPAATYGIGSATVGTNIYLFGGTNDGGAASLNTITCFTPPVDIVMVETGIVYILSQSDATALMLINAGTATVEIGVDMVYKGNAEGKGELVEALLYKDGAWTNI